MAEVERILIEELWHAHCRWDNRLSVAVPEGPEEIFYIVAFLRNKLPDTAGGPTLSDMLEDNENILRICKSLQCKQYLPHYQDHNDWEHHFGSKWDSFVQNKQSFDPFAILSPGLNIFTRGSSKDSFSFAISQASASQAEWDTVICTSSVLEPLNFWKSRFVWVGWSLIRGF